MHGGKSVGLSVQARHAVADFVWLAFARHCDALEIFFFFFFLLLLCYFYILGDMRLLNLFFSSTSLLLLLFFLTCSAVGVMKDVGPTHRESDGSESHKRARMNFK